MLEVLVEGATVTKVADRFGVTRQNAWYPLLSPSAACPPAAAASRNMQRWAAVVDAAGYHFL